MNKMSFTQKQKVRFLYKTILKLHRGMPDELHSLGNAYARAEFKKHKKCQESEAAVFIREWSDYAITLSKQLGLQGPKTGSKIGTPLAPETLNHLNNEQIGQLYELLLAASGIKKDEDNSKT